MKAKTRINPKTKKTEYKVRYLWKDGEGKRKDSETAWFPTETQAFKNAQILKIQKEYSAKEGKDVNIRSKQAKALYETFGKGIEDNEKLDALRQVATYFGDSVTKERLLSNPKFLIGDFNDKLFKKTVTMDRL